MSVEEDSRQEWTFTLYDFDNNGKVTREVRNIPLSGQLHFTLHEVFIIINIFNVQLKLGKQSSDELNIDLRDTCWFVGTRHNGYLVVCEDYRHNVTWWFVRTKDVMVSLWFVGTIDLNVTCWFVGTIVITVSFWFLGTMVKMVSFWFVGTIVTMVSFWFVGTKDIMVSFWFVGTKDIMVPWWFVRQGSNLSTF